MSSDKDDTKTEDPVLAYALATGALLAAACIMCLILMCCAKWLVLINVTDVSCYYYWVCYLFQS